MFVLRKISTESYLSLATENDKIQPYVGKYLFKPYDSLRIARFTSREDALEALEIAEKHLDRNLDVELVEVFPAKF